MIHQGEALTIDLGHVKIAAKQWGNPDGRRVLALHGWLDNAASFDFVASELKDCYVVAVDLPGHGLSGFIPEGINYHLMDAVANTVKVLDVLQWPQATLLGHSMGAAIASILSSAFPERVDCLIMIDAIGPLSESVLQGPQRLGRAVSKLLAAGKRRRTVYPSLEGMAKYRAETGGLSLEAAMALTERGCEQVEGGYTWRFDRRLLLPSMMYLTEEQVKVFLRDIQAPSLLLVGDDGIMIDNPLLEQRIAEVNNIVHTSIQGHHHLHMDSPRAVAQAINQFLV
ncbi:MAG: alpha/beta hydrolase [Coxiellaceae bacterium]|nr:alpha/beta hydrolase [Coxiellaceae bacterium]